MLLGVLIKIYKNAAADNAIVAMIKSMKRTAFYMNQYCYSLN